MTHIAPGLAAPRATPRARLLAVPALLALVMTAAACSPAATGAPGTADPSSGPSANPSAGPSDGPSAAPTTSGDIAHPTGAGDVVLRIEESGGMVVLEFAATSTPNFTLYGDGTVVWRDNYAVPPESSDNLIRPTPLQVAKLDEAGVQALLQEAIGPGALGVAQGSYGQAGGDIPATVFTINAGDLPEPKRVEVIGLAPDLHPQNLQVITGLANLAEKLREFDTIVTGQPYAPTGYRGVLMPTEQAFGPVADWPWTEISPEDFGGENEFFRVRDLTPEDVAKLGIEDLASGVAGFALQDGDEVYNFAVRPLLPDEIS